MNQFGKPLIIMGLVLVAVGLLFTFSHKLPTWLGRLPGDINIKRDDFSLHIPLTTCLLISALLSFVMWLFKR